jgi:peptidyl-prolyl cis-trans isomerase SurA
MAIRLSLLFMLTLLCPAFCQAQDNNSGILMKVDGINVEAGEFIRMYKKSLDPGKTMPVDEYLPQFVLFKLKVADAEHLGYDTLASFRNELAGYRNQLAQNYLTDTLIKDQVLRKAYQRYLTDINVWHILIALPQNASPDDTLSAYKKALEIRARIRNGEIFEQVARSTSDDKSAKINGGNLGYITVFQLIMPFEDAAYSLKKGALSLPVRTPYGYHIIKVTDVRPSRGRIQVAHIMKNAPPGTSDEGMRKAEQEINDLYSKLQEGIPFGELAIKYSDHKESASKGGLLNEFGTGEMIPQFSEAAFALRDTGDYSKPVRTIYGWHIIKLLKRTPPGSFEETRSFLESRINQSYLNSLSRKSFVERLKKEYKFRINRTSYEWFVANTDSLIRQGLSTYDRQSVPEGIIYSFTNMSFKNSEFADYIEKRGSLFPIRDSALFVKKLLDESSSDQLTGYENSVLEKKYPDFRYLMNEFHDGILLFNISEKKVWDRINHDSIGLQKYYEDNKYNYLSSRQLEAKIYILRIKGGDNMLASAYKKYSGSGDADKRLIEKFNDRNDTLLSITEGVWKHGDDPDLDKVEWKIGTQFTTLNGFPAIILIKKVTDALPLKFEEVQEKMMTGYQEYLDKEWAVQLKKKYSVTIDSVMLEVVKKKISNE